MSAEPTPVTAPPTYETLKELWLDKAPTSGASERYDREVNFEAWARQHGILPTGLRCRCAWQGGAPYTSECPIHGSRP
jgi:hypothetical protein